MEIQIHDIFSPPVASRIFAYPNVAAYEIVAQENSDLNSLVGTLNAFKPIPKADTTNQNINLNLAAIIAHMEVSKKLIFSEEKMEVLQDSLYTAWNEINEDEFSKANKYFTQDRYFKVNFFNEDYLFFHGKNEKK